MFRARTAVVLLLILPVLAEAAAPAAPGTPACETSMVPGLGNACELADGSFLLLRHDGRPLGTTHGADAFGPAEVSFSAAELAPFDHPYPHCVEASPSAYYVQAVYAVAFDRPDRYASMAGIVRALHHMVNDGISDAGRAPGGDSGIRMRCEDGKVHVERLVLPTPGANATLDTIFADVAVTQHNPQVKYSVVYDDDLWRGPAGAATRARDDRPGEDNMNNGYRAAYALSTRSAFASLTVGHEIMHTLGAVQSSAPYATSIGHCVDGHDLMCYRDGSEEGKNWTTTRCPSSSGMTIFVFDCGKDTYFHLSPAAGSYLSSHWNLGGANHRFVANQPGVTRSLWWDHPLSFVGAGSGNVPFGDVALSGGYTGPPGATIEWRVAGGEWAPANASDGLWHATWNSTGLDDGGYLLQVRSVVAGEVQGASDRTVMINAAPRLTLLQPAPEVEVVGGVVNVEGEISEFFGLQDFRLYVGEAGYVPIHRVANSTRWYAEWDTRLSTDGRHTLVLSAEDVHGRETRIMRNINVSNPPTIRIDHPEEGAIVAGTLQFQGAASGVRELHRVEWSLDGGPWNATGSFDEWTIALNTTRISEGQHVLRARAVDAKGSVALATRAFSVDNLPPSLTLDSLQPNAVHVLGIRQHIVSTFLTEEEAIVVGSFTIEAVAADAGAGVAFVRICILDASSAEPQTLSCVDDDAAPYRDTYWEGRPHDAGKRIVTVEAFDRAGRHSEFISRNVTKV